MAGDGNPIPIDMEEERTWRQPPSVPKFAVVLRGFPANFDGAGRSLYSTTCVYCRQEDPGIRIRNVIFKVDGKCLSGIGSVSGCNPGSVY